MAASDQNSRNRRKGEGIQPHPGQPSKAVGSPKERLAQSTRMEQRAKIVNMPASSRGTVRKPVATKATPARGKSAGTKGASDASKTGRVGNSTTKKTSTSKASRPTPAIAQTPLLNPRDTRFIQWLGDKWNALENHHQQRIFSTGLLILSLLLFASLTVFQAAPILSDINRFFVVFFGWSAYPLALGLVAFATVHLIEGIRQEEFVRLSLVIGLVFVALGALAAKRE